MIVWTRGGFVEQRKGPVAANVKLALLRMTHGHSTRDGHLWQCWVGETDSVLSQLPLAVHPGPLMEFRGHGGLYWEVASHHC